MTAQTPVNSDTITPDRETCRRVGWLAVVLVVTSLLSIPAGLLFPAPAVDGNTYAYTDIEPIRELWWGLLMFLSSALILNVAAQAIVTMVLVRHRGATWVTVGGVVMIVGATLQAVGVAAWAATYYFPTDSSLDPAVGKAAFDAANNDAAHMFGVMIPGAMLVILGTVFQVVGMFRSRALPRWIPVLALTVGLTFFIEGNGWMGLLSSIPLAVTTIGLAYYAWRRARFAGFPSPSRSAS